jgi:choline dehydrogenase-like flavoprotein
VIIDGRTVPAGSKLAADLCIIGAGAAGITLALALADSPLKTLVLESGGFEPDSRAQDLARGELGGLPYYALETARLRCLGGSTMHWGGWCRPLEDIDFEERPWIPYSGWPITRATLQPYYERAQEICQLGEFAYDPTDWNLAPGSVVPVWGSEILTKLIQFSPPTRFGVRFRDRLARSSNVKVCLNASVTQVRVNAAGRAAVGLSVVAPGGGRFEAVAPNYVLACGGIDNPRLLLASNDVLPGGVGNEHDLVGRFFADHIQLDTAGIVPTDSRRRFDLYQPGSREVAQRPKRVGGRGANLMAYLTLHPDVQRSVRCLNYSANILETEWSDYLLGSDAPDPGARSAWQKFSESLHSLWQNLGATLDSALSSGTDSKHPVFYKLVTTQEQAPNPASRVRLAHERDALGMPRPRLEWHLSELDAHTIRSALVSLARAFGGHNVARLHIPRAIRADAWPPNMPGSWHHCGTTRMHSDPTRGVVNANCRMHGVDNLYVAGSSVFPTSGNGNPTLTILALALRLGDHLRGLKP